LQTILVKTLRDLTTSHHYNDLTLSSIHTAADMEQQKPTDDKILPVRSTSVSLRSNFQILLRNDSLQSSAASILNTSIDELATQLELSRYNLQPESETDDHGNTLLNVRFYSTDSEPSTPTFINCRLKNVDFIQCRFYQTEFCNLTLSNVAVFYVDFHNAAVNGLDLEGHLWKFAIVRNAVLVRKSTQYIHNTRTTILQARTPLSVCTNEPEEKTVVETRRLGHLTSTATKIVQRYEDCFEASLQAVHSPRPNLLVRLVDYKHIISRIVQHCVGIHNPFFERYTRKPWAQIVTIRQTTEPEAPGGDVHVYCPESTQDTCLIVLALQYISTTRSTAINEYLHGPFEETQCTVSGPSRLRCDSKTPLVILHYNFDGGTGFVKTDDGTWRELMNFIRYSASDIPHIHLYISKHFWDLARWREGVAEVILQKSLLNTPNLHELHNFLVDIAKSAAPLAGVIMSEDSKTIMIDSETSTIARAVRRCVSLSMAQIARSDKLLCRRLKRPSGGCSTSAHFSGGMRFIKRW
jgi:hypothetical protein